ncbi:MAG: transcription termination factor NusA [Candidatus Nealsonbacteria bacterium]|nr:transcription termination factor NusA [Candidatus Nealsonbacteria bacterium]
MDLKNFTSAITQIAEEKGIPQEKVIEIIEMAVAAAYKKDYGKKGQITKAKLNPKTGQLKFWQIKQVVAEDMIYSDAELSEMKVKADKDEAELHRQTEELKEGESKKIRFNPEKHIMLAEAKKINPKIKEGEDLETLLEQQEDYGRIAAQTAKQVILQRIREAERTVIFDEYKAKEGEIISGIVQRVEGGMVFLDIGKILGILLRDEQVMGEFYRPGQRLKVYVIKVEETTKGPAVFLSRAYPKLISKLFELEVPEVSSGSVIIKSVAREAGSRSKIAVVSTVEGVDPIGSMVGQRGTRVTAVINELGGEKIDIIEWDEDSERYIGNAMSPAKVLEVKIMPKNKAVVITPEDQLSLAIGKDGQNVRLAAKLTGWKIDVRGPQEPEKEEESEPKEPAESQNIQAGKEEKPKTEKKKDSKKETSKKTKKIIKESK